MGYESLVIVPCHGIWKGGANGDDRDEWLLAPFQIEGNDHLCFKEHLLEAFKRVQTDKSALLVISGGRTKDQLELSEAESYLNILKKLHPNDPALQNVALEAYARDSMENVVFLICRYYEINGAYPNHIVIYGFEFKRSRFLTNHINALGYPIDKVTYVGNAPTPPESVKEAYFEDLAKSEYQFAVKYFEQDWYGIRDPLLKKKISRNPFNDKHTYSKTNPQLREFLAEISDKGSKLSNEAIRELYYR